MMYDQVNYEQKSGVIFIHTHNTPDHTAIF